jgi:aminoacylase
MNAEEQSKAQQLLIKLIQFKTVSATASSSGSYRECADFMKAEIDSNILPNIQASSPSSRSFFMGPEDSPSVVMKWEGKDPALPVILLNCHYDVVPPGVASGWTVEPFSGEVKDGRIYGRGTQDMKCVVAQYLVALKKLAASGFKPERSIVLTIVPDEECGGAGMACFLASDFYQQEICVASKGIAIALDEGLASEDENYSVFYGERLPWWVQVTATGLTGHGSRFIEPTAMEQIIGIANKALAFRKEQKDLLFGEGEEHVGCSHAVAAGQRKSKKKMGDVTSLNITTLTAGVESGDGTYALNVVPPKATATFDIRVSPLVDPLTMKAKLDQWCQECSVGKEDNAGGGLSWEFTYHGNDSYTHSTTSTGSDNPWYKHFEEGVGLSEIKIVPDIFPAATDSRFLRALGIRALGFSPMRNSEILLHEYDENIKIDVYNEGLDVYVKLIEHLGKVGKIDCDAE